MLNEQVFGLTQPFRRDLVTSHWLLYDTHKIMILSNSQGCPLDILICPIPIP